MTELSRKTSGFNLLYLSANNFWVKSNHEASGLRYDFKDKYEVIFFVKFTLIDTYLTKECS